MYYYYFFDQLSMTLLEQVRDPLLDPNPPVENHSNNQTNILL